VPRALRVLGFSTTHVGNVDDGAPARGSLDSDVLAFARQTNQIIVTSNHDMMLICNEANQRFVWLDPRGRQYSRVEQVLLVFSQIEQWEELLGSNPSLCVRSMRTKCEVIESSEAARLAGQRMRNLERRRRSQAAQSPGPLFTAET
jgi:predicted nuclease of predicted toxin-antitoxin system